MHGWVAADMMKVMMWHTPAGIIDEGGATLVGYLNFNITLISAPENNVMSVRIPAWHAAEACPVGMSRHPCMHASGRQLQ